MIHGDKHHRESQAGYVLIIARCLQKSVSAAVCQHLVRRHYLSVWQGHERGHSGRVVEPGQREGILGRRSRRWVGVFAIEVDAEVHPGLQFRPGLHVPLEDERRHAVLLENGLDLRILGAKHRFVRRRLHEEVV
jgi:hypothetical protein